MKTVPPLALHYAELGIPALFLKHGSKRPACKNGVLDATSDKAKLQSLLNGSWDDLVGLKPGPFYLVLDIDDKCKPSKVREDKGDERTGPCMKKGAHGRHGSEKLELLELEYDDINTAVVRTPSGGRHLWLKKPVDRFVSIQSPWGAYGIDVRSDNGYVVAAGEPGYTWEVPLERAIDCPEWILEALPTGGTAIKSKDFNPDLHPEEDLAMLELCQLLIGAHTPTTRFRPTSEGESEVYIGVVSPDYDEGSNNLKGTIGVVGGSSGRFHCMTDNWMTPDGKSLAEGDRKGNAADPVYNSEELENFVNHGRKHLGATGGAPEEHTNKGKFRFLSLADIKKIPPPEFIVDEFLVRDTVAMLLADPGVGKTFLAIDWMMHIATGKDWNGYNIKKAEPVIYVIGEGLAGFGKRVAAWQQVHDMKEDPLNVWGLEVPVNLYDSPSVTNFVADLEALEEKPALVIIDTLARSTVGAEENSAKDMGLVMANADRIRRATGACVLLVHHSGYGDKGRGRGSSTVPGALYGTFVLTDDDGEGSLTLTNTKQKDDDKSETVSLRREKVWIDGTELSSCVITYEGVIAKGVVKTGNAWFTPKLKEIAIALQTAGATSPTKAVSSTIWHEHTDIKGKTNFDKHRKTLCANGLIYIEGTGSQSKYWVEEGEITPYKLEDI